MPILSIYFIRASLIYFLIGITIGALLLIEKGIPGNYAIWSYRSAHIELTIIGWIVQLVMGTAYWILPRFLVGPPRGNPHTAWVSFVLLNFGLILGVLSVWFLDNTSLEAFSRLLQLTGIGCFAYVIWPRILTFRKDY